MDEAAYKAVQETMYEACFNAVAPKDRIVNKVDVQAFANCLGRYMEALKVTTVRVAGVFGHKEKN